MAKRKYSPEDRKLVRRLLLLHGGNVPLVHQLTGFPVRTMARAMGRATNSTPTHWHDLILPVPMPKPPSNPPYP